MKMTHTHTHTVGGKKNKLKTNLKHSLFWHDCLKRDREAMDELWLMLCFDLMQYSLSVCCAKKSCEKSASISL